MAHSGLDSIDDNAVLAIAAIVTEDLAPEDKDPASSATTEDEARLVVARLLEEVGGLGPVDPGDVLPPDTSDAEVGRRLLGVMLDDPSVAPSVQDLVDDPPEDEQMSVELAIGAVILLGLLVTWMQTKVDFHLHHHDGKTDVDIAMTKDASSPDEVKTLVKAVASALGISA